MTLALVAGHPAQARYAKMDSVFLKEHVPQVEALGDSLLAHTTARYELYGNIAKLIDVRNHALDELSARLSLTSFDGIETRDKYESQVLYEVGRNLEKTKSLPHLPISDADEAGFHEAMGVVPDLGFSPAPYLVLAAIEAVSHAAEAIRDTTDLPDDVISSLALDVFSQAYSQLTTDRTDDITATRVESFRQDTVVERLRCPKDGSNYRVRQIKKKLFPDESFATIWYLRCNICYEDREIWFPAVYLAKLLQAEKEQNLKVPPKKIDPHGGLEP